MIIRRRRVRIELEQTTQTLTMDQTPAATVASTKEAQDAQTPLPEVAQGNHLPAFRSLAKPLLSMLLCMILLPVALLGQSAHLNYSETTFGNFITPHGLAIDKTGNVYVADDHNGSGVSTIYKETPTATGYTETAIPVGSTSLQGLTCDGAGTLYYLPYDYPSGTYSIVKLTPANGTYTPTTVVTGIHAFNLTIDAAGDLFYTDTVANSVVEEKLVGGGYVALTLATGFNYPQSVAVDTSGNLYVTDNSKSLTKLTASTAYSPSTIATGLANYNSVAVDAKGVLFLVDPNNYIVLQLTPATGGSYTSSTLFKIHVQDTLVAVDSLDDVFLVSSIARGGPVYEEKALEGADGPALFFGETTLHIPLSGSVTFTFDQGGTLAAKPYSVLTQGDATLDFQAAATQPANACVTGHTYAIGDTCSVALTFTPSYPGTRSGAIRLLGSDGSTIAVGYLSGTGDGPLVGLTPFQRSPLNSTFSGVEGLAPDSSGNLWLYDYPSDIYQVRITDGKVLQDLNSFDVLGGVALDGAENLFVTDSSLGQVTLVPVGATYDPSLVVATGVSATGLSVDAAGNVFIADSGHSRVLKATYVDESYVQTVIGSGMSKPFTAVVDSSGNVYISDSGNNRVLKETPSGSTYVQSVFPTTVINPTGLYVDPFNNLFIADAGNHRILKETLTSTGYVESVYATVSASIGLTFLAVDQNGNLFASLQGTYTSGLTEFSVQMPANLSYTSTAVGSTSIDSPKMVTLTNLGNFPLTLLPPASGMNPSLPAGFQYSASSTCPQLSMNSGSAYLAPNASCTEVVSYVPIASGVTTGNMVETDNAFLLNGSTQIVANFYGTATGGLSISPGSLTFSATAAGSTSAVMTATITNSGNAVTLTAGSLTDSTDFTTSNNCGGAIAANSSCTVSFTFTPQGSGALTSTFSIGDANNSSTMLTVALSGTATGIPQASLTPASASFGSVATGSTSAAQTFTLTNPGSGSLSISSVVVGGANATAFSIAGNTCGVSLAAGASCSINVTFTPNSTASYTASLTVTDNAGGTAGTTQTSSLSGTGAGASATLTPATVALGVVGLGQTVSNAFTLINTGSVTITITNVSEISAVGNSGYALTNPCPIALAPGASCTITVGITPHTTGNIGITLSVTDSAGTQTAVLSGTATALTLTPGPSFDYGSVPVNTTVTQVFTLANISTSSVTLVGTTTVGTGFTPQSKTCGTTLAAGASCTLTEAFTPTGGGAYGGLLVYTDSTNSNPSVSLAGTGGAATLSATLSPSAATFGTVGAGTTSPAQSFTLTNTGSTFTISSVALTGPNATSFAIQSSTCGTSLSAGANCTVSITFSPAAAGFLTASLVIADSVSATATGSQSVSLNGSGVTPTATLSPASADLGNVGLGSSSSATFTLTNTGVISLAVNKVSIANQTNGTEFSAGACPATLDVNKSCSIVVTFSAVNGGAATGVLTVQTSAGTLTSNLTGTGIQPVTVSTTNIDFGNVYDGNLASIPVTITNNTNSTVVLLLPTVNTSPFFLNGGCVAGTTTVKLPANSSCLLTFTWQVNSLGPIAYNYVLTNTDGSTITFAEKGVGIEPVSVSTTNIDFGNVYVGDMGSIPVTITNNSNSTVVLLLPTANTTPFFLNGGCLTGISMLKLPANSSCVLVFTWGVSSSGPTHYNYVISDPGGSTFTFAEKGVGIEPVSVSTTNIDFGTISLGNIGSIPVTLTNSSTAPVLLFLPNVFTTPFFLDGSCVVSGPAVKLLANSSCVITFTLQGLTSGSFTYNYVLSNTDGSTITFAEKGVVVTPTPDYNLILPGGNTTFDVFGHLAFRVDIGSTLPLSPFTGTVNLTASGLPAGTTYTFAPGSVTPGSHGTSSTLTIELPHTSAALSPRPTPGSSRSTPLFSAAFGAVLLLLLNRRRKLSLPGLASWILIMATVSGLSGCGTQPYELPGKMGTVTITGTSGTTVHSITVQVATP